MKNNKGFTLIELLAVIVILAIVSVIATTTFLPSMSSAREDAFRIEASNAVGSAGVNYDLYSLGNLTIENSASNTNSCTSDTKVCFTIDYLIDTGKFKADRTKFKGKVEVTNLSSSNPTYTLYMKKNSEFAIINKSSIDYTKGDVLSPVGDWEDYKNADGKNTLEMCSCS